MRIVPPASQSSAFCALTTADVRFKEEVKSVNAETRYPGATPDPFQINNICNVGIKQESVIESDSDAGFVTHPRQSKHRKNVQTHHSTNNRQPIKLSITPPATPREQSPESQGPAKRRRICDRPPTRQIMRWTPSHDQLLLLGVEHFCRKKGITIPWDKVASIVGDHVTGKAIEQHLVKMTKKRADAGLPIPPPRPRITSKKHTVLAEACSRDELHDASPGLYTGLGSSSLGEAENSTMDAFASPSSFADGKVNSTGATRSVARATVDNRRSHVSLVMSTAFEDSQNDLHSEPSLEEEYRGFTEYDSEVGSTQAEGTRKFAFGEDKKCIEEFDSSDHSERSISPSPPLTPGCKRARKTLQPLSPHKLRAMERRYVAMVPTAERQAVTGRAKAVACSPGAAKGTPFRALRGLDHPYATPLRHVTTDRSMTRTATPQRAVQEFYPPAVASTQARKRPAARSTIFTGALVDSAGSITNSAAVAVGRRRSSVPATRTMLPVLHRNEDEAVLGLIGLSSGR